MATDRSGFLVPAFLAAWLLGVAWAVAGLEGTETVSSRSGAVSGPAQPAATEPVLTPTPTPTPAIEVVETFDPPRLIAFLEDGEYLGVRFDEAGNVIEEHPGVVIAGSTAPTTEQVVVNGEPYFFLVDGIWINYYMAAEHLEFPPEDEVGG